MPEHRDSEIFEEYRHEKTSDQTCNGSHSCCPLPEHSEDKHGKYTRADKSCVFLYEGETSFGSNSQKVFPFKKNSNSNCHQGYHSSHPYHFLFIAFFGHFFVD